MGKKKRPHHNPQLPQRGTTPSAGGRVGLASPSPHHARSKRTAEIAGRTPARVPVPVRRFSAARGPDSFRLAAREITVSSVARGRASAAAGLVEPVFRVYGSARAGPTAAGSVGNNRFWICRGPPPQPFSINKYGNDEDDDTRACRNSSSCIIVVARASVV